MLSASAVAALLIPFHVLGTLSNPRYTLQESPEVVPTGEMPRNIIVVVDRNLVDKVSPGTRVALMGIASLYNSAAAKKQVGGVAIRTPYMQVGG